MAIQYSSISKALSNDVASIAIPKPGCVGSGWANGGTAFSSNIQQVHQTAGLPTPPNSLSPNLPAHGLAARACKEAVASPPSQVDSDIDLQDAVDHANSQTQDVSMGTREDEGSEEHGIISPAYLAEHHLPEIVLRKGPIAIRHIMNRLSAAVPGFCDIPPAKARRIVVSALESRHGGGPQGDVLFEKVGWGRWHAKIRNNNHRESTAIDTDQEMQSAASTDPSRVQPISGAVDIPGSRRTVRNPRRLSYGSWTAESWSSRSEQDDGNDMGVTEHDLDTMEIDDDNTRNHYRPTMRTVSENSTFLSDTEEEDWSHLPNRVSKIGSYSAGSATSLQYHPSRRRSHAKQSFYVLPYQSHSYSTRLIRDNHQSFKLHNQQVKPNAGHMPAACFDFTGVDANSQEREAIEALMRMGSM